MRNVITKLDMAVLKAKTALMQKKEASDQLIVMFIIIAVAAGIAGLLYIFGSCYRNLSIVNLLYKRIAIKTAA